MSILTTRGEDSNSPRYAGFREPPYRVALHDDSGDAIDLSDISASDISIAFQHYATGLVTTGTGEWEIIDAVNGKASYHWSADDVATSGTYWAYVTVQFPWQPTPTFFDRDLIVIDPWIGAIASMTIQDVNLAKINGTTISGSTLPVSGPVTVIDGGDVAVGATTDATYSSGAGSVIALLKGVFAKLAWGQRTKANSLSVTLASDEDVLPVSGTVGATIADGSDVALGATNASTYGGSGAASVVAILKGIYAQTATAVKTRSLVAAYGSNASSTSATTDYTFAWGITGTTPVDIVLLQNNSGSAINYNINAAASAGTFTLQDKGLVSIQLDGVQITSIHFYTSGTVGVNQSSAGIAIKGYA